MNGELGIAPIPYEPVYHYMPQEDPGIGLEYYPISYPAQEDPGIGLEYYPISYPAQEDPGIGLEYMPPTTGRDYMGSLWDFLKGTTKAGIRAYTEFLKKPGDPNALLARIPRVPEAPYDRSDYQLHTPYPRATSGSTPSFPVLSAAGGISPTILLLGVGALAVFFLMKGK